VHGQGSAGPDRCESGLFTESVRRGYSLEMGPAYAGSREGLSRSGQGQVILSSPDCQIFLIPLDKIVLIYYNTSVLDDRKDKFGIEAASLAVCSGLAQRRPRLPPDHRSGPERHGPGIAGSGRSTANRAADGRGPCHQSQYRDARLPGTGTERTARNSPGHWDIRRAEKAGTERCRAGAAACTVGQRVRSPRRGCRMRDRRTGGAPERIGASVEAKEIAMTKIEIGKISGIGRSLFVICLLAGAIVTAAIHHPAGIITGAVLGIYLMFAVKVVQQWEKVAVLRLGRYVGLRGPGLFHIVPIVETLSPYVDQRVRVAGVSAESTLTRYTVPVNVDAIVFWLVWNAEKCLLEVENFIEAINMSAQTALRESIGRHELAQMITERETLGRELQRILDEKTNPWGITVQSVEVRDVRIPQGLEDAMSRQAQAERERQARIILGQAEKEISHSFVQAAVDHHDNPVALHLRAMNMPYEAIKEKGAMVIVPSSAVETMGLGGSLAVASLNNSVPR